jgi:hypothetical protein
VTQIKEDMASIKSESSIPDFAGKFNISLAKLIANPQKIL